jgi:dolichyl-phosphate beta-glucosyltransferase
VTPAPDISVVIPVFEGAGVIRGTIDAVQRHASSRGWTVEIVVGLSHGRDRTEEVLAQAQRDYANVSVLDTSASFGKGGAVRGGMLRATGAIRCFIDADNGVSFDQVDSALDLLGGSDVVIGSRYTTGGSAGRRTLPRIVLSRLGNVLFRVMLGLRFTDTRAPLKVFRGDVAERLFLASRLDGFGFDTEVLFLARKLGYRVVECPVTWQSGDASTVNVPRDAVRSVVELVQVRWHWLRGTYEAALVAAPATSRDATA